MNWSAIRNSIIQKVLIATRKKNTKIKWGGPLWDFDWAFGYNESNDYFIKNNLLFYKGKSDSRPGARFFSRFMEVPEFRTKYKARWKEMKPELVKLLIILI